MRRLRGIWLGRRPYAPVHDLQRELQRARQLGAVEDTVLFVEHEPVITLGRGAHAENLLAGENELSELGVDLVSTGRGGDVTVHAPGQLVCYPIVDLRPDRCDVRRYVNDLTETMRRLALDWNVAGGTAEKMVGLWVDALQPGHWSGADRAGKLAKLGAIGVRLSRWVTMHGFALNLSTDLELFRLIVPCGISRYGVTSIQALTHSTPELPAAAERALTLFSDVLEAEPLSFESYEAKDLGTIVSHCAA